MLPSLSLRDATGAKQADASSVGDVNQAAGADDSPKAEHVRLGKFELRHVLGEGAFGAVYLAHDDELDRMVAVKMPRSGRFLNQAEEDRFLREARSGAQLCHPGIVPVYEVGREKNLVYIVSEYVDGVTLDAAMRSHKFTFRESAELLAELATALEHAHSRGVVHRDLKPSNIMLQRAQPDAPETPLSKAPPAATDSNRRVQSPTNDAGDAIPLGRPRLMDFGLARRIEAEDSMTLDGELLGTPAYMSPEQARGEAYLVDGRSDVYSLGVILYQLLVDDLPFRGNLRMLLQQIVCEEPRSPRRMNDRIPRDLETITLKCLTKEPGGRYQTAGDLAAELQRFLSGRPISARPVGVAERAWRWCRRNPVVSVLTATAATAILFGLVAASVGYLRASRALQEARRAETEAEASGQDARQAVHDLFTRVSEESLLDQPGMQPLRRDLLQRAKEYYERFVERFGDRVGLESELALTHFRLGFIAEQIEPEKALAEYVKARELQEQLVAHEPDNAAALKSLGDTLTAMGRCLAERAAHEQSRAAYNAAVRIRSTLGDLCPDDVEIHRALANSYMNLAMIEESSDREAARRQLQRAQAIRRQLLEAHPDNLKVRRDLAVGCYGLADAAQKTGNLGDAKSNAEEAVGLFESICRKNSKDIASRCRLALSQRLLADLASVTSDGDSALALYSQARASMEKLARENPAVVDYQSYLAEIDLNHAQKLCELNRYQPALIVFAQAAATLQSVVADHPESDRCRRDYIKAIQMTAEVEHHLGRLPDALASLKRLRQFLEQLPAAVLELPEVAAQLEQTKAAMLKVGAQ